MNAKIMVVVFVILVMSCANAAQVTVSTTVEAADLPSAGTSVLAMAFLPAKNGYAANVAVSVAKATKTLQEYMAEGKTDLEERGHNVLRSEVLGVAGHVESIGRESSLTLHFLQTVYIRGGVLYIITASALADTWDQDKAKLLKMMEQVKVSSGIGLDPLQDDLQEILDITKPTK
jgi:hypothetical protein